MPEGPDYYNSFTHLSQNEIEGSSYQRRWKRHEWKHNGGSTPTPEQETIILAIHGGGIETGTSELALATASMVEGFNGVPATSETYDYYLFEGLLSSGNGRLHVTASNFDDPVALELVQNSTKCISYHGCTDTQPNESTGEGFKAILIGGLDSDLKEKCRARLVEAGFNAYITNQEMLDGDMPENIANKTKTGGCCQFEITTSQRSAFFTNNTRAGRASSTTEEFWRFVNAVRQALKD
ncbi:poly-gamma-glutamate hydrolase family protein [Thermoflavimicrobium dichotomicum]|uniref:Phage-related replication protein YjqB, UPF0714/DUF867 family n=1 Tax=Thermoflavimicrobium dichotomicum TaxID=46223 RepID=A0A1I3UN93_9BACL|nr:poly-gamma-glutamate hydrolase family protein [Thermoflavimicrobium dichotomicum]SFJ83446.1 Phage-related replication protein YjqB, UPF0714/DUF867 family [Thermoflavimicrobium dichotomicum]